jgi:uncharacterized protein YgiM (DUF1202 family)
MHNLTFMKSIPRSTWLAIAISGCIIASLSAADTATVKENRVNVRGQASLYSEVITQLKQGEQVNVLEEITLEKPKEGEPSKWLKIQMPANTPVWVFSSFIDPTNKTVKVNRLNVRAGPGENYSIVGRLEKGAAIKEIRAVDEWTEIQTPTNAYAFVASEFVERPGASDAAGQPAADKAKAAPTEVKIEAKPEPAAKPAEPAPAPAQPKSETAPAISEAPQNLEVVKAEPPPAVANDAPTAEPANPVADAAKENAPALAGEPRQESVPAPTSTAPEKTEPVPPRVQESAPAENNSPAIETPQKKRIVRREGLVRSTVSIQAPTHYELISPDTRKTINYLYSTRSDINLKDYKGKHIVVTGEEGIDKRWPNTPVIEIETLELAP